jgi:two-component system response regulator MprA
VGRGDAPSERERGGSELATRVLLIDDDVKLTPLLERGLAYEGFEVQTAGDGEAGLTLAASSRPHVVLLDIAMPGLDGFEVCRRLRLVHDAPIIMLTARDEVQDKVTALDLGADDYVSKPFAFVELIARIRAVLRRADSFEEALGFDDLVVDPKTHEVLRAGTSIELTPIEFDLLLLFMRHPRQVLTRQQLLERVWGSGQPEASALDVHIGHLRQKLEAHGSRLIHTIRGIGFALRG